MIRCEFRGGLNKSEPLNLFLWDGNLHAKPWESAVAKYAKSCGEAVSEAGPA